MSLVGTAPGLDQAITELSSQPVDVIVFQPDRSRRSSLRTIRTLRRRFPKTKVLLLGPDQADEVVEFVEAGVHAYVPAGAKPAELISTLEAVCRRETPTSPKVAGLILQRITELSLEVEAEAPREPAQVTDREREVLELVAMGLSNKEIGSELGIAESTVKNHVHSILSRLGVERRRDAVCSACRAGILRASFTAAPRVPELPSS